MATVIVRGGATGFAQEIEAGRHRLVADEPVEAGGTDVGSSPWPLDAAHRERLLEIAKRCPVHRTLVSEINIRTRLV
jgi:uncharacterized OsmC-like protein